MLDALDDLDADAPWVPNLLYQRVEDLFGLPPPSTALASRCGPAVRPAPAGIQLITLLGQSGRSVGELVLRVPSRILREEPDRVGAAVASALRQRGWTGSRHRPARGGGVRTPGLVTALTPVLDQALGPGLAVDPAVAGLGPLTDLAAVPRTWA